MSVRGNIRDALGDSGNSSSSVGKGGSVGRGAKGSSTSSGGSSSSTRPGSNSSLLLHSPSSSSRSKDKDKESEAAGSTGSGRARLGSSTKGNKARDDNNNNSSSSADAVARALVQANANAAAASLSDDEDEDDDEEDEEALDGTDAGGGGKAGTGAFTLADVSEVLLGLDRLPPGLVSARDRVETLYSVRQGKGASSNNAPTVFVFAAAVGSHSGGHDATSATSSSSSSGMQCLHLSPLDVLKRLYEVSSALAAAADELMDLSAVATTLKSNYPPPYTLFNP